MESHLVTSIAAAEDVDRAQQESGRSKIQAQRVREEFNIGL